MFIGNFLKNQLYILSEQNMVFKTPVIQINIFIRWVVTVQFIQTSTW